MDKFLSSRRERDVNLVLTDLSIQHTIFTQKYDSTGKKSISVCFGIFPDMAVGWSIITFFFSFDLVSLGISDHTQNIHCDFFWEFFETIFIAA